MNNQCSCPQALVQVVNKPVNYTEINAICLDLKHSSRIDSGLPGSAAVQEAGAAGLPALLHSHDATVMDTWTSSEPWQPGKGLSSRHTA